MSEISIALSKKKIILALTAALIFVFLGIQFILKPENYVSSIHKNLELIRIVGFASLIFFGLCVIYLSFKVFDKKSGLIINQKGIIDNSNFTSVGLIEWSEIIGIRTERVKSTYFLLIEVSNPQKYMQEGSKLKALLRNTSMRMYGTPISITSNSLNYNFKDLEVVINEAWEFYKSNVNR